VVLVLPEALHATPDLDRVTYAACLYAGDRANAGVGKAPAPEQPTRVSASTPRKGNEEAAVFVSAVRGAPHPASDAELILHRLITADAELRPLFSYNQPVTTRYETTPTVDLVWEAGRLVIEIDGDDHRRCGKFAQDRLRDFHLLMSGYHVIRFTSSRVLEQSDMVVDWIRDAVRYLGKTEK
jgi:very-short-patch-repair endonuclease